jgi:hypothetical protein
MPNYPNWSCHDLCAAGKHPDDEHCPSTLWVWEQTRIAAVANNAWFLHERGTLRGPEWG